MHTHRDQFVDAGAGSGREGLGSVTLEEGSCPEELPVRWGLGCTNVQAVLTGRRLFYLSGNQRGTELPSMMHVLMRKPLWGAQRGGRRISEAKPKSVLPPGLFPRPQSVQTSAGHFSGGETPGCAAFPDFDTSNIPRVFARKKKVFKEKLEYECA